MGTLYFFVVNVILFCFKSLEEKKSSGEYIPKIKCSHLTIGQVVVASQQHYIRTTTLLLLFMCKRTCFPLCICL